MTLQFDGKHFYEVPNHEAVTLGYAYEIGLTEPNYPLPVISHSCPTLRAINDMSQWYNNEDGWWS